MGLLVFISFLLLLTQSWARSYLDDYLDTYREILIAFEEENHRARGEEFDRSKHELVVSLIDTPGYGEALHTSESFEVICDPGVPW